MGKPKTLTVSYGTFACELEGFDNPFPIMRKVVAFYQKLAETDPEFGLYNEIEDVDTLIEQVLDVSGVDSLDAAQIPGGIHLRNTEDDEENDAADDVSTNAESETANDLTDTVAAAEEHSDEHIEHSEAPTEELAATDDKTKDASDDVEEDAPKEETVVSTGNFYGASASRKTADEDTVDDSFSTDIDPIDIDATGEETESDGDLELSNENADTLEGSDEITETTDDEPEGDNSFDSQAASEAVAETEPDTSEVATEEAPSILRLDAIQPIDEDLDEIANAPNFMDHVDVTPEPTFGKVEDIEPALPEETTDLSDTFASAMRRPSVTPTPVKPEQETPSVSETEAPVAPLELSTPIDAGPDTDNSAQDDVSEDTPSAPAPLQLGAESLRLSEDAIVPEQEESAANEPAPAVQPLALTPSLKVTEAEDTAQKPKGVEEIVAARAEENSRKRLRIIRNEDEADKEADTVSEVSAKPIEEPAPVEVEVAAEPEAKPAAPEPMMLLTPQPSVQPEPLALKDPQPVIEDIPTPEPVAKAPIPAPVAAETPKPRAARGRGGRGKVEPGADIAAKLQSSFDDSAPAAITSQLSGDNFEDDGEMNLRNFVHRAGASTLPELMEASAVYATLIDGMDTFNRGVIMSKIDELGDKTKFNAQARVKSFSKLLRSGQIMRIEGGQFALSQGLVDEYEERMAETE